MTEPAEEDPQDNDANRKGHGETLLETRLHLTFPGRLTGERRILHDLLVQVCATGVLRVVGDLNSGLVTAVLPLEADHNGIRVEFTSDSPSSFLASSTRITYVAHTRQNPTPIVVKGPVPETLSRFDQRHYRNPPGGSGGGPSKRYHPEVTLNPLERMCIEEFIACLQDHGFRVEIGHATSDFILLRNTQKPERLQADLMKILNKMGWSQTHECSQVFLEQLFEAIASAFWGKISTAFLPHLQTSQHFSLVIYLYGEQIKVACYATGAKLTP